ncbi:MAG: glutamate--tRNA ligase, partial [cyanobacterium endosymbiont of Rhopalodia yunnanensis]
FIIRIEDTDIERSRLEYTENIKSGLTWLGLNWDEGPFLQTQRLDLYRQGIQSLLDKGFAYRCYCTPEELKQMREEQKAKNQAPRYDNRHRHLTEAECQKFESEGRKPVIRFIIDDNREIVWNDLIRNKVTWKGTDLGGDMAIARVPQLEGEAFGQPLYNLAVVVDDLDMKITHVIRGEDHIANTAKQILLYEALGETVPDFAHTPLILNQDGRKLSKRDGASSIDDFRKMGFLPDALANYIMLLGWTASDPTKEIFTLSEAAKEFSLERVNKAGAKFDWDKLDWINSQYLHQVPASKLVELAFPYWQEAGYEVNLDSDRLWLEQLAALIRPSLTRLTDVVKEGRSLFGNTLSYSNEALEQLRKEGIDGIIQAVVDDLAKYPQLTEDNVREIIRQVTNDFKIKKGLVMRSLRAGLMGELHGPDLIQSWLLLNQKGLDVIRLQNSLSQI